MKKLQINQFHYVYQLIHKDYGAFYIGKSNNTTRRLKEHQKGLVKKNTKLYQRMAELGIEDFTMEVLFTYNNEWHAMLKETELICQQKLISGNINLNSSIWRRYS